MLTGNTPIREPALGMRITVNCPYTAQLSREYTLMIDPGLPVGGQRLVAAADPAPQTTSVTAAAAPQPVAQVQAAKPTPTQTRALSPISASPVSVSPARAAVVEQVDQSPITTNSQYFVQPGDSLYGIATRIENRQVALRPAANAIFSANPGAFTENDVNQLTAGVWIAIPDFLGAGIVAETIVETNAAPVASEYSDEYTADDAATEESTESTYAGFIADDVPEVIAEPVVETPVAEIAPVVETVEEVVVEETAAVEEAVVPATPIVEATEEPVVAEAPVVETEAAEPAYLEENTADLRPGDIVIGGDTSVDSIDNVETTATDASVEPAQAVSAAPVVSLPDGDAAGSGGLGSWLMWIGGAGLGVLLGLALFFGRRIKERFGGAPVNDSMEQLDDDMTDEVEVLSDFDNIIANEPSVVSDVDFQLDDSMISSQSISLDADLDAGTGLQNVTDVDVAQDFGFSASTTGEVESAVESVIDLELPEEAPEEPEKLPTDIIPPNHRIEDSILESEEAPSIDASAEYDLSMIVDATKQALGGDDLTAKDLMAVQVGTTVESEADSNEMTLNNEVDIQALEQDYQEEYTQTLAMNEEIEQAAIDLAIRLDKDDSGDVTAALPSVAEATQTAAVLEEDLPTEIASLDVDLDDMPTEVASLDDDLDDMPTEIASLDDDLDDLEDTSVNPQLTAKMEQLVNEKTVEMPNPGSEKTVMMPNPGSEPTVEMPSPGSEPTVEMQVESGKIDTKKSQAS